MSRRVMVIIPERITEWIDKGEVIDRYYNPGSLFDHVDLVLLNDDRPDPYAVQRMVGTATVEVHNLPAGSDVFVRTFGWRPALLRRWARPVVELAARLRPDVVRCHGVHLNAFAAAEIKRRLGIPFVVSVHVNPDEDLRGRAGTMRQRVTGAASVSLERAALRAADLVLPVYRPIVPYLERMGVERYVVAYNVLNAEHITPKETYARAKRARIVSVGRQFPAKNPSNIVRAVAALPDVELDLVGAGELHDELRQLAASLGVADRVRFEATVDNDELCRRLPSYDLFAIHSEFWELSKALLEALLTGLPAIVSRRRGAAVPELEEGIVRLVEDSVHGYREAIEALLGDDVERERLGRRGRKVAEARWSPIATEQAFVDHYRTVLGARA
jgi:glycosyltransferase involved in cell wall biosynthesis